MSDKFTFSALGIYKVKRWGAHWRNKACNKMTEKISPDLDADGTAATATDTSDTAAVTPADKRERWGWYRSEIIKEKTLFVYSCT